MHSDLPYMAEYTVFLEEWYELNGDLPYLIPPSYEEWYTNERIEEE